MNDKYTLADLATRWGLRDTLYVSYLLGDSGFASKMLTDDDGKVYITGEFLKRLEVRSNFMDKIRAKAQRHKRIAASMAEFVVEVEEEVKLPTQEQLAYRYASVKETALARGFVLVSVIAKEVGVQWPSVYGLITRHGLGDKLVYLATDNGRWYNKPEKSITTGLEAADYVELQKRMEAEKVKRAQEQEERHDFDKRRVAREVEIIRIKAENRGARHEARNEWYDEGQRIRDSIREAMSTRARVRIYKNRMITALSHFREEIGGEVAGAQDYVTSQRFSTQRAFEALITEVYADPERHLHGWDESPPGELVIAQQKKNEHIADLEAELAVKEKNADDVREDKEEEF